MLILTKLWRNLLGRKGISIVELLFTSQTYKALFKLWNKSKSLNDLIGFGNNITCESKKN